MLSHIFTQLPNGIIREIVQYAGLALKKRNGKYMGQIPKDDSRYYMLSQLPAKNKDVYSSPEYAPDFVACVTLTRQDNPDHYIYFDVFTITMIMEESEGEFLKDKYYINYNLTVVDKKNTSNRRNYLYTDKS